MKKFIYVVVLKCEKLSVQAIYLSVQAINYSCLKLYPERFFKGQISYHL